MLTGNTSLENILTYHDRTLLGIRDTVSDRQFNGRTKIFHNVQDFFMSSTNF